MLLRGPWILFSFGLLVASLNLLALAGPTEVHGLASISAASTERDPSATIGSTTGLTGGSTTVSGGFTYSGNHIYVVDLAEKRSASTFGYFSGSWQQLTGRHTAGIKFISVPSTYGGTPPPNVASITHSEWICVEQGTEMSVPSGTTMASGTATGGVNVYGGFVNSGNTFTVQTSDTGAIESGRHLEYWVATRNVTTYNDGTPTLDSGIVWTRQEFVLVKLPCFDASIDTRRTYGQPNKAGQLPADANAPLREINFGPWDYKGGLFVGNIPSSDKDASGTARTQLYVQGGSEYASTYAFASLSLFDQGKPNDSAISGGFDLGLYFPSSSDTNLATTENTVKWSNKWNITAGDVSSSSTDWSQHPFKVHTLTNGNSNDYINIPLTPSPTGTKPAMALSSICLGIVNEQEEVDTQSKLWHYFASREYQSGSTFPRNDCAPRVWLIVEPS